MRSEATTFGKNGNWSATGLHMVLMASALVIATYGISLVFIPLVMMLAP